MALIKCPECGRDVSDLGASCPKCGCPIGRASVRKRQDIGDDAGMRMLLPVGRSAWAIAAGYLAFFSVLCIPSPFALLAGLMAVREIRRDPTKHGMGRAIFGILMGGIGSILLVGFLVLLLLRSKSDSVDTHLQNLTHSEANKRMLAADSLGKLKEKRAVEPLISALSDAQPSVRQAAIKALAQIKDDRAIDPLVKTLKDGDSRIRQESIRALGEFSDPRIAEPLVATLNDAEWTIRHAAVVVMEKIKDPRTLEPILTALKDPNPPLRVAAIKTLGHFRDPKIVAPLLTALDDADANIRQTAMKSLWLILAEGKAAPRRKGIVLKEDGTVHAFQSILPAACQADPAANADIVLTLSEQKKTAISVHPYNNGPSITRYQHDLNVKLVNKQSKKEFAKNFTTTAPPAPQSAPIELVALGDPVTPEPVEEWAVRYFFER
ncbi:MAG: DUF4190 domain-containing protein [Gemmataceae bacterium]|nr:DUF4190 domain-containing protein [Gemmataceae bacterium]